MQAAARLTLSLCVLTSALASVYQNGAKLRRDGVLNLYPFPRVGRASPRAWSPSDLVNELQYEPLEKRQLYAFPRVGRGDTALLRAALGGAGAGAGGPLPGLPQRRTRTDGPGMWFGPRLGRSFRSEDDDMTDHNGNSERSDPEQADTDQRQAELQALATL